VILGGHLHPHRADECAWAAAGQLNGLAADVPYPDIIATLFPAGNGFAVDKGAQTEFYLSAPQDPGTADALNFVIDDRCDLRGDYVDTIKVARIGAHRATCWRMVNRS
jgi:hypothetical protein